MAVGGNEVACQMRSVLGVKILLYNTVCHDVYTISTMARSRGQDIVGKPQNDC